MAQHSPPSTPYDKVNGSCAYHLCGSCIGNSECGFCADFEINGNVVNNTGTCESLWNDDNGTAISKYRPPGKECALFKDAIDVNDWFDFSQSPDPSVKRKWYPNSCPGNRFAPMAIVALFLYIAFFAPGMGPLPWTINSEIYPTWARSTAISIATMTNWLSNLVVSMTFLTMADNLGQPITFGIYAGLCFLALIFIMLFVPETKGRRLEDMQTLFNRPFFLKWCCK
jgi:SP family myo-inositol transporter-like MFS transporter 13